MCPNCRKFEQSSSLHRGFPVGIHAVTQLARHQVATANQSASALNGYESYPLYKQEGNVWGHFVIGATSHLTPNINLSKGLSEGTAIVYDSLSFMEGKEIEQVRTGKLRIAKVKPGDSGSRLIPHIVNVQLRSVKQHKWPANQSLSVDRVFIYICPKRNTDIYYT